MKSLLIATGVVAAIAVANLGAETSHDSLDRANQNFVAPLKGDQEVPPVDTKASGVAKFKVSDDGMSIEYKLNTSNIEAVTQAHIHLGAKGDNGPPVVFLFGPENPGVDSSGVLAEGTITAGDLINDLSGEPLSALIAAMESGDTYVNVHTEAHPPGEIRGQIDRGSGAEDKGRDKS